MRIVIFGGTTEGRKLSRLLADWGAETAVSVATEYGREAQGTYPGVEVLCGRRDRAEMAALLDGAALCVDATHPYAVEAAENIRAACRDAGVLYRRLLREAGAAGSLAAGSPEAGTLKTGSPEAGTIEEGSLKAGSSEYNSGQKTGPAGSGRTAGTVFVDSAAAAAAYLQSTSGNILLANGSRELARFSGLDPARLFPRVLPDHDSLSACERFGIPHRNIIAMQGPFSRELNEALIRQYHIAYLVTKDGGRTGGYPEKAAAARTTGAVLVVIRRPVEEGASFQEIAAACARLLGREA